MLIQSEVFTFFLSCLLGGFFSFYYDCFRLLRIIVPHHGIFVFFEDIFYFSSCSILAFSFIVNQTDGAIRGFVFVGIVFGYILYFFTISVVFMKIMRYLFKVVLKIFNVFVKIIFTICLPFKLIVVLFHYIFTKIVVILCVFLKNCKKIILKSKLT